MGWQDAPIIGAAPAVKPKWTDAPLASPATPAFGDDVPVPGAPVPQQPAVEEPSIWEKFKSTLSGDPILDMFADSIPKAVVGAPEVAADMIGNAGVQAVAGLTAPFVGQNDDDAANYVRSFIDENSMRPQGDSARELTGALGEAFEPLGNIKQKLGDTAMAATGSPAAATAADLLPDLGMALLGGPKAVEGAAALPEKALRATPEINPKVTALRDADIRMRPSDIRAMNPGAKKVPGEFREKFADAPNLKKDMTLHNQARLTDIVAKDLGVKALDEASLAKAKEAPAATYDMVEKVLMDKPMSSEFQNVFREAASSAKLPKGEGSSVTRIIGALRRRAAKRMQNDQVATEEAGFADRELADRLEESLGKELEAVGEPQLLGEYRDARQQFAKIHDVETATIADHIDAATLKRMGKRVKLSGGLKLAADASEYAPNVTGHSLKTAARAGGEIEGSKEGITKGLIKAGIRKIPGMDVGKPSFQETLGIPNEARAASYGKKSNIAPPREPQQGGLDLREALDLEAPPGEVGAPARTQRDLGPQVDALGNAFEFDRPPGEVGIPPEAQISLQDLLGLGEPLAMKPSPGRVGKPKRKS